MFTVTDIGALLWRRVSNVIQKLTNEETHN